jgi:glycerol-3-phosphate acyltransferase PlsY
MKITASPVMLVDFCRNQTFVSALQGGTGAFNVTRVISTAKSLMFFVVCFDCLRGMRRVLNLE